MKVRTLRLHNYRKFKDYVFRFNSKFTVLIGDNASGKTSILDAIAIMIGSFLMKSGLVIGKKNISASEVRLKVFEKEGVVNLEPQKPCFVEIDGEINGQSITWKRNYGDRGRDANEIIQVGKDQLKSLQNGDNVMMPVLLYYGTGRLWDKHRKIPISKPESRLAGYRNCLDPKSDHHLFQKWFKQLELSSIQKGKDIGVLEAVRNAVKRCIPDCIAFSFDIANDALMLELNNEGHCPFDNLSDGYRNMLAMVADIAHRSARLNPHLGKEAALETKGIVLVDEINLHLHPKWQRRVVDDLKTAFPNIQFIVTTHSPFIIQSLEPGEVIDLNEVCVQPLTALPVLENIGMPAPTGEYSGKSIEDIVEDVMGVDVPQRSRRYREMYETAKEYYKVLEKGKIADSQEKEKLKRKLDELSAPFSNNPAYHAFLKMERMAAGIGKSEKEIK